MDSIFKPAPYQTSRDYSLLIELMQKDSIICMVDLNAEKVIRDAAKTIYSPTKDGRGVWQVSARGYGYIYAFSKEDFITSCREQDVEFFVPPASPVEVT